MLCVVTPDSALRSAGRVEAAGDAVIFCDATASAGGIAAVEAGNPRALAALSGTRAARAPCAGQHAESATVSTVTGVNDRDQHRQLYRFELEPEVRDWLDSLSDSDFKRADEVAGMLAEKGTGLGGPWSDHLEGPVWELRVRLHQVAARVTYWCRPDGAIVLLTVFRKTRQHDPRQIDRAVRAQQACERDHRGPAAQTYERQV
jgi:hypothetical protein